MEISTSRLRTPILISSNLSLTSPRLMATQSQLIFPQTVICNGMLLNTPKFSTSTAKKSCNSFKTRVSSQSPSCTIGWPVDTSVPDTIILSWDKIKVMQLRPRPQRCNNCHRCGHHTDLCMSARCCVRCSGPDKRTDCTAASPACSACNGEHEFSSPACPIRKQACQHLNSNTITPSDSATTSTAPDKTKISTTSTPSPDFKSACNSATFTSTTAANNTSASGPASTPDDTSPEDSSAANAPEDDFSLVSTRSQRKKKSTASTSEASYSPPCGFTFFYFFFST